MMNKIKFQAALHFRVNKFAYANVLRLGVMLIGVVNKTSLVDNVDAYCTLNWQRDKMPNKKERNERWQKGGKGGVILV